MMNDKTIDISIVVITYNYARYLKNCLDSCLLQNFSGLSYEVIVVNDGSVDGTDDLLKYYEDKNVRIFKIPNSGIEKASNFGFRKCRGRYIVRVDADDQLELDYLCQMAPHINKSIDLLYPDYSIFDQNNRILDLQCLPDFDPREIINRGDFLATGTLFSRNILNLVGGYSENLKNCGLENYEFILKCILNGATALHVPKKLFKYRRHNLNISKIKKEKIICFGVDLFKRLGLGQYRTNEFHPYKLKIV